MDLIVSTALPPTYIHDEVIEGFHYSTRASKFNAVGSFWLSVPPPGQSLSVIFVSFEEKESSISLGNSTDEMEGAGIILRGEAGQGVASVGLGR